MTRWQDDPVYRGDTGDTVACPLGDNGCAFRASSQSAWDQLEGHALQTNDDFLLSNTAIMWQELSLLDYMKLKEGHVRHSAVSDCDTHGRLRLQMQDGNSVVMRRTSQLSRA